jgi:homoserine dehydrogenase
MDLSLTLDDIDSESISHSTNNDIYNATSLNKHWKIIGTVEKHNDGFFASVKPEMISSEHPLASIKGATNAITYSTELLGDITLIGPGARRLEIGYAAIEDILSIHKKLLMRQYYLHNDIDEFRFFSFHNQLTKTATYRSS